MVFPSLIVSCGVLIFFLYKMEMKMGVGKADQIAYKGDAGEYSLWSNSETPLMNRYKVAAGKLILSPFSFALPHYADSSKIGFVLEGTCTFGLVSPNSPEETVLQINKGDVIPLPSGVVSWCFNGGDTDLVMVFIGETSNALVPGQFTYFLGGGVVGFLAGFQPDFVGKIFDIDQKQQLDTLINSQQGALLVKLENGTKFPEPNKHIKEKLYATIDDPSTGDHNIIVKGGGFINSLTEKNFPILGGISLSAKFVKLEGNAMLTPSYVANGSIQISYVGKGSGRIRVVGSEGKPALDSRVEEGDLFIIPQYFATAEIADECGIEVFSIITSSNPIFGELVGNNSVWKALSPVVLRSTLNVSDEFVEIFKSKNTKRITIIPPSI